MELQGLRGRLARSGLRGAAARRGLPWLPRAAPHKQFDRREPLTRDSGGSFRRKKRLDP